MYYIKKSFNVSIAHSLNLDYDSPCRNKHGHNLKITVYCKNKNLDNNGMVVDFKDIKQKISDEIDHKDLNEVFRINPTAENLARWIVNKIPYCYKADVEETEGSLASYEIQS